MTEKYEYEEIQVIGKLASEIYRRGYSYVTKELEAYEINYIQLLCLVELYIKDGQTQEDIADSQSIDKSSIHRAVRFLAEHDYVSRVRSETDKRSFNLFLTKKGQQLQPELWAILKKRELLFSEGIDPAKKTIAFEVLTQMAENAERINQADIK